MCVCARVHACPWEPGEREQGKALGRTLQVKRGGRKWKPLLRISKCVGLPGVESLCEGEVSDKAEGINIDSL